jgi:copper chaperone CopZ
MKRLLGVVLSVAMVGMLFSFSKGEPQQDTFKVSGTAACKTQIETLIVTKHGVTSAVWDAETQLMTVIYDGELLTRHEFFMALAEAGFDNQGLRSKDRVYEALSEECKYTRSAEID